MHGFAKPRLSCADYLALDATAEQGNPRRPTSSAQRLFLGDGRAAYPDATVVCPPLEHPPEDPARWTTGPGA